MKIVLLLVMIVSLEWSASSQVVYSGANAATNCTGGSSGAWVNTNNWCGGILPGSGQTAQFAASGSATTIGVNMNGISVANKTIGAIELASSATGARIINNSSGTAGGAIVLNGSTINGIPNIVLRNNSAFGLTINNGSSQPFGISLGNMTNNIINIDGSGGITINTIIKDSTGGPKKLTKDGTGPGVLLFTGANTYSGGTIIKSGILRLGASGVLADAGIVDLDGGTLSSGATTGFNENMGVLQLTDHSTIALGSGIHSLNFAASNMASWVAGKMLVITGWTGMPGGGTTGTAGKIFAGMDASGLTTTQLGQIRFLVAGTEYPAMILSTGEIIPANPIILPVSLLSFSASWKEGGRELRWTTATETNNTGFEVQRSTDAISYNRIGFVYSLAPGGNSNSRLDYDFKVTDPAVANEYYRLRQVDRDGHEQISHVVALNRQQFPVSMIEGLYPNPANRIVTLRIVVSSKVKVAVSVSDINGKQVLQKNIELQTGSNAVPLDISILRNGYYLVKLVDSSNEKPIGRFIKQ